MNLERLWSKNFIFICLNNFFTFLSFYVLATAFPLFMKEVLHGTGQQIGLVITIFVIGNISIRPFAGVLIDRFGSRKIAIVGFGIFCAVSFAYLGATTMIFLLLVLRLIHGLSHGLSTTASNTLVTSLIPENKLGQGIGYFSMFMSIAMVFGPALGLTLWENYSEQGLLWAGAIIGLASWIFAMLAKDSQAVQNEYVKKKLELKDFFEVKAIPASMVVLLLAFSYASLTSFLSLFAKENGLSNYSSVFFIVFALFILIPRPFVGKFFDIHGPKKLIIPSILAFVIGMLCLSQATNGAMLLLAAVLMGLGHGILVPGYQTIVMSAVSPTRRGKAVGTYFMLFDLGYGLGSYFLGILLSFTGYRVMFVIAAGVVLASAIVYKILIGNRHELIEA